VLETRLHLLVVPGAAANSLGRAADGSLRVRVAAPAREGKANRELVRYLADLLGLPKTAVRVDRGEGARHKVIVVSGLDPDAVRQRLEAAGAG
jgi:uncharacterized protein (TIGR00251 family)